MWGTPGCWAQRAGQVAEVQVTAGEVAEVSAGDKCGSLWWHKVDVELLKGADFSRVWAGAASALWDLELSYTCWLICFFGQTPSPAAS